jgi:hypothetical protein
MSEQSYESENVSNPNSYELEEVFNDIFKNSNNCSDESEEQEDQKRYFIQPFLENQNSEITLQQTKLDNFLVFNKEKVNKITNKAEPKFIQKKRKRTVLFTTSKNKCVLSKPTISKSPLQTFQVCDFKCINNERKKIATNFFNEFLKNLIEGMLKICRRFYMCLKKFPKKFICYIIIKSNKFILEKTLEELLEDEVLYKNRDSNNCYPNHLKIKEELKKDENRKALEKEDKYKFLEMKFKDLFNNYYLTSTEFQQKKDKIKKNEIGKFVQFSKSFIQDYKN